MLPIRTLMCICLCSLTLTLQAQIPQSFKYQGLVKSDDGPLTNQKIEVEFLIRNNQNILYNETHQVMTSPDGIFSCNIGEGDDMQGSFEAIDWGNDELRLDVLIDGEMFEESMSFHSVPYALYALNGEPGPPGPAGPQGEQGPQGIQGIQGNVGATGAPGINGQNGADGAGVQIVGSVASAANLPNPYNGSVGDMFIAQDTGQGHVWNGSSFDNVGEIRGPQGPQGVQGIQGIPGATGANGISCWDTNGNGLNEIAEDSNGDGLYNSLDCQGPQGIQGPQGVQGDPGQQGEQGPPGNVGNINLTSLKSGNEITILTDGSGMTTFDISDSDNDPRNEYQAIRLIGNTLLLEPSSNDTSSVNLSGLSGGGGSNSPWKKNGSIISTNEEGDIVRTIGDNGSLNIELGAAEGASTDGNHGGITTFSDDGDRLVQLDVDNSGGTDDLGCLLVYAEDAAVGVFDADTGGGDLLLQLYNGGSPVPSASLISNGNEFSGELRLTDYHPPSGNSGTWSLRPQVWDPFIPDLVPYLGLHSDPTEFPEFYFYEGGLMLLNQLWAQDICLTGDIQTFGICAFGSDRKLKENILPISNALNRLSTLSPVSYHLIGQDKGLQYGFIAQELQETFPELVIQGEEYLTVNYNGFHALAIKSIQEQQEIIQSQERKIEELEKSQKEILQLVQQMKAQLDGITQE